ncbi:MAG: hydroxymethylbilane synthase [Actinomycetota bacterium]
MSETLRIGTRRSRLALRQAEEIAALLAATGVRTEIVPMTTSGDEGAAVTSDPQGLKGLWIDTILDALETGDIHLAVHSAKDLPAEDDDGFAIAAVPMRADPFDVLVLREAASLGAGSKVGTSSVRRAAQMLAHDPRLKIVGLRGNVETRLRKVEDGEIDAAVLAGAGLARLGIEPAYIQRLDLDTMIPAPGQGCLAVQCLEDEPDILGALAAIDHPPSHIALDAERSLMWRLGGGCALPLGAYAMAGSDGVSLVACVCLADGSRVLRADGLGADAESVAGVVAADLIERGAEEILAEVRDA